MLKTLNILGFLNETLPISLKKAYLTIHQLVSKNPYKTLDGARMAAFRAIESGDLVECLIKRNIGFAEPQRKGKAGGRSTIIKFGAEPGNHNR